MGIVYHTYLFTYATNASTCLEKFEEGVKWTGIKRTVVHVEPVTQTRVTPLLNDQRQDDDRTAATELRLTIHKTHQYHDQYLPLPPILHSKVATCRSILPQKNH